MFAAFTKSRSVLAALVRPCTIALAIDGAANMTGRISGLSTRVQQVCDQCLMQICRGLHQSFLKIQKAYPSALDENFYTLLTSLIGHLFQKQCLIS